MNIFGEGVPTYKCPDCKEIILIVLPGDTLDEDELNTKVANHARRHEMVDEIIDKG